MGAIGLRGPARTARVRGTVGPGRSRIRVTATARARWLPGPGWPSLPVVVATTGSGIGAVAPGASRSRVESVVRSGSAAGAKGVAGVPGAARARRAAGTVGAARPRTAAGRVRPQVLAAARHARAGRTAPAAHRARLRVTRVRPDARTLSGPRGVARARRAVRSSTRRWRLGLVTAPGWPLLAISWPGRARAVSGWGSAAGAAIAGGRSGWTGRWRRVVMSRKSPGAAGRHVRWPASERPLSAGLRASEGGRGGGWGYALFVRARLVAVRRLCVVVVRLRRDIVSPIPRATPRVATGPAVPAFHPVPPPALT
jgi:hypothetical protein